MSTIAESAPPAPESYIDFGSVRATWNEGLIILMYHAIERPPLQYPWRGLYVSPGKLRSQLRGLLDSGARFTTLSDWVRERTNERQVVVTIDDAFANVFEQGLPVLQELGVPAITYVVADGIGQSNFWDHAKGLQRRPLMDRRQILEWIGAGHEIGAHSLSHCNLSAVPPAQQRREIFDSKKILEDLTGRPVRHFCYPYGGCNEATRELVIEAGYETACSVSTGYNRPGDDLFTLRRLYAHHRSPFAAALMNPFRWSPFKINGSWP